MPPRKSSKAAPAKKTAKAAPQKVAAKKPAPKAAKKPVPAAKAISPAAAYRAAPASVTPRATPAIAAPSVTPLAQAGKVWWAFAWRQYVLGFLLNAVISMAVMGVAVVVGQIRFQVWLLTLQLNYPGALEAVNTLTGLVLSLAAAWVTTWLVVRRGAARKFKTFSLAHHKPNGSVAKTFRDQLPLAFGLWWRQTVVSVVFLTAAVSLFVFTHQPETALSMPEKVYIGLVLVFFLLANIAIIDRLVTKRHFKWFSLVVESRTDKQA